MGAGASALEACKAQEQEATLSKSEIKELYSHLSAEYNKKVNELMTTREQQIQENPDAAKIYTEDPDFTEDEFEISEEDEENASKSPSKVSYKADPVDDDEEKTQADDDQTKQEPVAKNDCETEIEGADEILPPDDSERIAIKSNSVDIERENPGEAETPHALKQDLKKLYQGNDLKRKLMEIAIEDQPGLLNMKVKVNAKVLDMLGDDELDAGARRYVDTKTKITPKVLGRLGEAFIMPEKAVKRLGDAEMTRDQRVAMMRAEEREAQARADRARNELNRILDMDPDDNPELSEVRSKTRVNAKAVEKLGGADDEKLMGQVRNQITKQMTISKKTIQLTGDEKLLPKKVMDRRGSEMKDTQILAMRKAEAANAKDREKQAKENLQQVLDKDPTGSMMLVPSELKGNAKLLELAGATQFIPDKANKVLGDEMSQKQRRRMLDADRKSRESSGSSASSGFKLPRMPTSSASSLDSMK